ncbi:MAG: hypothetical protein NWQ43_16880 [Dolichospermum sp.]|nr:hypothetical protein [Dolichospermum sp.]
MLYLDIIVLLVKRTIGDNQLSLWKRQIKEKCRLMLTVAIAVQLMR